MSFSSIFSQQSPVKKPPLIPRWTPGSARRQIGLGIAAVLGWLLALGALQGWLDFRSLLADDDHWLRDDLVFVNKEVALSDSVGITSAGIPPSLLEQIRSIEGVALAEPIVRNHFPASVEIGGGAFPTLVSEIFLEAIPGELFRPGLESWKWNPGDPIVPVLVPRQFLNLYNFGFAPGKGLPPVSETTATRVRFSLIVNPTQGGPPVRFTASIAGFSDEIESILVPVSYLEWANSEYGSRPSARFQRVAVALRNPDSANFHRLLEKNRLLASRGTKDKARLQVLLDISLAVVGTAGGIIVILIFLLFIAEAESVIADHQDRIRKLYFLGHRPGTLLRRLIGLRILAALIPAVLGLIVLWFARRPIAGFLEKAGIDIHPHPSSEAFIAWASLLLIINFWLVQRLRARLLALYR